MTNEKDPNGAPPTTIIEMAETIPAKKPLRQQIEKTRTRQKSYVMDLRIHSPVSLGYLTIDGIDTAPALVRLARVKGLDMIAVTDFYSGQFIDRVAAAAQETDLTVIPGSVIRCRVGACDDVTMTILFPESFTGTQIEEILRELGIPESARGNRNFLLSMPFDRVIEVVEGRGGVLLPSRMDKTPHRMAAIPALVDQYGFRAFDLAYADTARFFKVRWPKTKFQLFSFSNANALAQVGSRIARMKLADPGFTGIKALVARDGAAASRAV